MPQRKVVDVVNHPPHYNSGSVECIDAIGLGVGGEIPIVASLAEAPARIATYARSTADALSSLAEALVRTAAAKTRTGADALSSLAESAVRAAEAKVRTVPDSLSSLAEAVAGTKGLVRTTADSIASFSEAAVRAAIAATRTAADALSSTAESAIRSAIAFIRREHRPSD